MAIVLLRTIIIFSLLLLCMRILGKRQLGELELSELVVSILIADIGTLPLQDIGMPLINCLVPIITLFSLELLLSGLTLGVGALWLCPYMNAADAAFYLEVTGRANAMPQPELSPDP